MVRLVGKKKSFLLNVYMFIGRFHIARSEIQIGNR